MSTRKISETTPPSAPKPKAPQKNLAGQFADLPFEEKISAFKEIKAQMRSAFEVAFKQQEERADYVKENFEQLMR